MGTKEPELGLGGVVELMELINKPLQGEQLLKLGGLRVNATLLPSGHRLRCGVEKLGDLPTSYTGISFDGVETGSNCSRHRETFRRDALCASFA